MHPDQCAFRRTGSTTAALIALHQKTTTLLTVEPYAALISLGFTKAFDTVRHSTLVRKLSFIDIPDAIYNFFICFLEQGSHVTRYAGRTSEIAPINASVEEGSGFGPSSFDVVAFDLHPLHQTNFIVKYSDDTYFIVPASARFTVSAELKHIFSWASLNNLRLNTSKSKEMIIRRRSRFIPPQSIEGVERVKTMKVLGVVLSEDLIAATHISGVLESCSRSLYALRILQSHGLPESALHEVARATTLHVFCTPLQPGGQCF